MKALRRSLALMAVLLTGGGTLTLGAGSTAAAALTPLSTATQTSLNAVSCPSTTRCIAVGSSGSATFSTSLAEGWNGTKWTIETTPNPIGAIHTSLISLSCLGPNACAAVGNSDDPSFHSSMLIETWDGHKWTIDSAAYPSGATEASLSGVSCTSQIHCIAVGGYTGATIGTLAEVWNGIKWSVQTTPNPTGATRSYLYAVSCTSPTVCTAAGESANSTTVASLAEAWNGAKWVVQHTPNAAGGAPLTTIFTGASCRSASACTAVGYSYDAFVLAPVAESWNGTKWAIHPTPNPPGATATLESVWCTSSSRCTAVGFSSSVTAFASVAEAWNGTKWTLDQTKNPAGASRTYLYGVSCTSASACTAVGSSGSTTAFASLAEVWNGTKWLIAPTPNP